MEESSERAKDRQTFFSDFIGAVSDKGPTRTGNEDTFWVPGEDTAVHLGALFIVADGVGGQQGGAEAARLGVETVQEQFYAQRQQGIAIPKALKFALQQANTLIFETAQAREIRMSCTMVAAVQDEGTLQIAHAGDARAYLARDGKILILTRDDTWVQEQVRAGIITAEEAEKHALRNIVTQAIGNKAEVNVHISTQHQQLPNDVLLLCSDGLYDSVEKKDIYYILTGNPPAKAAKKLVRKAIAADASDNVTAVVVGTQADQTAYATGPFSLASNKKDKRRKISLALAALVVLLMALALIWLGGNSLFGDRAPAESTLPQATRAIPAAGTVLPTSAPGIEGGAVEITVSSTFIPTSSPTATSSPTQTPTATPTAVPEVLSCTLDRVFVWQEAQIASTDCDQIVTEEFVLNPDALVRILDPTPILVTGPDASCAVNEMINIASVENPELTGWVLAAAVEPLSPGEQSCAP